MGDGVWRLPPHRTTLFDGALQPRAVCAGINVRLRFGWHQKNCVQRERGECKFSTGRNPVSTAPQKEQNRTPPVAFLLNRKRALKVSAQKLRLSGNCGWASRVFQEKCNENQEN